MKQNIIVMSSPNYNGKWMNHGTFQGPHADAAVNVSEHSGNDGAHICAEQSIKLFSSLIFI